MSIIDLEAYIQERLRVFDPNIDTSSGSEADKTVVQPLLRRLGPDPFSMDVPAFILDRLNQEFPNYTTKDGDAITDLLVKPAQILLDPIVRENRRVRGAMSFRDPSTLTVDEAESLGANFFVARTKGDYSKGPCRLYYAQPQQVTVSAVNFFGSRGGLNFVPESVQSIAVEEMLFNLEGDLYYFDVNTVAEQPGDQYNIEPDEIVSVAGLPGAVKVTNKRRFQGGIKAQSASDYLDYVQQNITERSLVTKRGIVAGTMANFPEMTRINVVGYQDPEMQRDILEGGGLGGILKAGLAGVAVSDGEAKTVTRRFHINTDDDGAVDFTVLIGPPGTSGSNYRLTLYGEFLGASRGRDFVVRRVVKANELDLEEQVMPVAQSGITWSLRKNELTISGIPGGILFPEGPNGTIVVPDGQVHIGGCTDVMVRGTVFDSGSLVIDGLTDDEPLLKGTQATCVSGLVRLNDYVMSPGEGSNYSQDDSVYTSLDEAVGKAYALQLVDGSSAGIYRVETVTQTSGLPPALLLLPTPTNFSLNARWRLIDVLDVDLNDPKETRVSGVDLQTTQQSDIVNTQSGTDFHAFGVSVNDVIRIENGPDAADYVVKEVPPFPSFTTLRIDRPAAYTSTGLSYKVFRANKAGGIRLPLARPTSVDLLDSSSQPVGSIIPYAKPIGIWSTAFANPAHGVKEEVDQALLGLVTQEFSTGLAPVGGKYLELRWGSSTFMVHFPGTLGQNLSLSTIIDTINAVLETNLATFVGSNRIGINPFVQKNGVWGSTEIIGGTVLGSSALPVLFGGMYYLKSNWIRCDRFSNSAHFSSIRPSMDFTFDVLQLLDGNQVGTHKIEHVYQYPGIVVVPPVGLTVPPHISVERDLSPESDVQLKYGARSYGKARLYFLDPTTIEFNKDSYLLVTTSDGAVLRYLPDFTMEAARIPALPGGTKPKDISTSPNSNTLTSAGTDFVAKGIRVGDLAYLDYVPVTGSVILGDPVSNLAFTTFIVSLDGGPDKIITFMHDSSSLPSQNDVTRKGVADQINSAVGKTICKISTLNKLELEPEVSMVIRKQGTANALLGFSLSDDTDNDAKHAGTYVITQVLQHTLTLATSTPTDGVTETRTQLRVTRPGTQRVGATQMSINQGPAGFYYCDVELISEGTGDIYNIDTDTPMQAYNYRADGYRLTTEESDLSFSRAEKPHLHVSRTINEVGTNDDPENATTLIGQNLQFNYDYSTLVGTMQDYLQSELERVVCSNPLSRHLIPHFIRFDLAYTGGPQPTDVQPDIETLIQSLFPDQQLQVSAIESILEERGSTNITNPLTLYGVIHNPDRTVSLEKSEDRINVGRLAAFIPDRITLNKGTL